MSTVAVVTAKGPGSPEKMSAEYIQKHQDRMQDRIARREKRLSMLIECLDADRAAEFERDKAEYDFNVSCTIREYDTKQRRMQSVEISGVIRAQNEDDAWASFCDKYKVRVGPKYCNRRIEKRDRKRRLPEDN